MKPAISENSGIAGFALKKQYQKTIFILFMLATYVEKMASYV